MGRIAVVDYDSGWSGEFEQLRSRIWPTVRDLATAIEHVGSTSVPGLAAKPIIDISIVARSEADIPAGIQRLATIGYVHRGDLGVEGREAFGAPVSQPRHHLYLCPANSQALANHLAVRNYLRANPTAVQEYGVLKKQLGLRFVDDIEGYTAAKTDILLRILRKAGLQSDELKNIERINRRALSNW